MVTEVDAISHVVTLMTTLDQRYIDKILGSKDNGDGSPGKPHFSNYDQHTLMSVVRVEIEDSLWAVNEALELQFEWLVAHGVPLENILDPFEHTVCTTHLLLNHWENVLTADDDGDDGLALAGGVA